MATAKVKVPKIKGSNLEQSLPSPVSSAQNDYEAEDHFNTLMKAHEIQNDPEKMKKVHKLAGRKMGGIKSIQGLKDYAQAKYGQPGKPPMDPGGDDSDESAGE